MTPAQRPTDALAMLNRHLYHSLLNKERWIPGFFLAFSEFDASEQVLSAAARHADACILKAMSRAA